MRKAVEARVSRFLLKITLHIYKSFSLVIVALHPMKVLPDSDMKE
jgi:hypothetical protein